jgi:hypothetical protein
MRYTAGPTLLVLITPGTELTDVAPAAGSQRVVCGNERSGCFATVIMKESAQHIARRDPITAAFGHEWHGTLLL